MTYPQVTQFESRRHELERELQLLAERAARAAGRTAEQERSQPGCLGGLVRPASAA
jgi:hypothetical protein